MKLAVTGASGFIGKYVLRELSSSSHQIIAISRNPSLIKDEFENIETLKLDINDCVYDDLFEKLGRPDLLIHLAWEGLPNYKSTFHFERVLPNQFNFLKNLINQGLSSIFITGTCFEYGNISGSISSDVKTYPINPYGFAKDNLRKQLEFLQKEFEFEFIWARIFYIYGHGQAESSLYTSLKNAVKRGDKVFNMSGGEQIRDFLPVDVVASKIVDYSLNLKGSNIINISSGKPISIRLLVENWIKQNNWDIKLNLGFYPYPDYEPFAFWGNNIS